MNRAITVCALTFLASVGAWLDFARLRTFEAHDQWNLASSVFGPDAVVIDEFSAPLIPLASLLYLLIVISTLRTKVRRFPMVLTLISESLLLAALSCRSHWGLITLLALQTLPPYLELKSRGRSTPVFARLTQLYARSGAHRVG